jgi:hypothetical protein
MSRDGFLFFLNKNVDVKCINNGSIQEDLCYHELVTK